MPVALSHLEDCSASHPTSPWPAAAAARLGPAASALQVMANSKKEPEEPGRACSTPVPDIQAAQTTLQVIAAGEKAQSMWHEAFQYAMAIVDNAVGTAGRRPRTPTSSRPTTSSSATTTCS